MWSRMMAAAAMVIGGGLAPMHSRRDPETSINAREVSQERRDNPIWQSRKQRRNKAAGMPANLSSLPKKQKAKYRRRKKG